MKIWAKRIIIVAFSFFFVGGFILGNHYFFGYKGRVYYNIKFEDPVIAVVEEDQTFEVLDTSIPITEYNPKECLYILCGRMSTINYHATVVGDISTNFGSLSRQTVRGDKYYKDGRALYETKSISSMVSVGKKFYIEKNNEVNVFDMKDLDKNIYESQPTHYDNLDSYIKVYGLDFRNISNYNLNDETILEAKKIETDDDTYKFEYKISPSKATSGYKINVKKMGDLASVPDFSSCKLTVVMNKNFEPISVNMVDKYTVTYSIFNVKCTSNLTITYDINQDIEIP